MIFMVVYLQLGKVKRGKMRERERERERERYSGLVQRPEPGRASEAPTKEWRGVSLTYPCDNWKGSSLRSQPELHHNQIQRTNSTSQEVTLIVKR